MYSAVQAETDFGEKFICEGSGGSTDSCQDPGCTPQPSQVWVPEGLHLRPAGPALQAKTLSSNFSLLFPQGGDNQPSSCPDTAEHEPLYGSGSKEKQQLLDCVSKQHTHKGRDCASYSMSFNSSETVYTMKLQSTQLISELE